MPAGRRLPAEFEPHERTIMGWPCRASLWGPEMAAARRDYAAVANAIAAFEPVTMIANPGADAAVARAACAGEVEIVELPIDDSWLRDSGPIYVLETTGPPTDVAAPDVAAPADAAPAPADAAVADPPAGHARLALHFGFNAWGEKFPPWDRDAVVGGAIARHLGDRVERRAIVLEGGSVLGDGAGTLLTTEQCLLHPNRNPSLDRAAIEMELIDAFGLRRVLWLGRGLMEDRDTDGHVDLIASVCAPGHVLLQTVPEDNPNHDACAENRARLDAAGLAVTELPLLPYVQVAGESVAASYLNLYVCNGAVIVPVTGAPSDPEALAIIAGAFPDRQVVPVPGAVIAYGGGGPHCITQQVPARG